jgi:hypothetical protein
MNSDPQQTDVTTADRARSANNSVPSIDNAERPGPTRPVLAVDTAGVVQTTSTKSLAPLFAPGVATEFRSRWDAVQRSFVDEPREAVRAGDELVAQAIKSLTETFSSQRMELEVELKQTEEASTESLRLALRRYRSFFERLLSI